LLRKSDSFGPKFVRYEQMQEKFTVTDKKEKIVKYEQSQGKHAWVEKKKQGKGGTVYVGASKKGGG